MTGSTDGPADKSGMYLLFIETQSWWEQRKGWENEIDMDGVLMWSGLISRLLTPVISLYIDKYHYTPFMDNETEACPDKKKIFWRHTASVHRIHNTNPGL